MTALKEKPAKPARNLELGKIHQLKAAMKMDDSDYRNVLWQVARVTSAADLDFTGRQRVVDHMGKLARLHGVAPASKRPPGMASDPRSRKIRACWLDLKRAGALTDASEAGLEHWVQSVTGVEKLQWLKPDQAHTCIERLKAWHARVLAAKNNRSTDNNNDETSTP